MLIAEGFLLKVGDFGLARDLTERDYYRKITGVSFLLSGLWCECSKHSWRLKVLFSIRKGRAGRAGRAGRGLGGLEGGWEGWESWEGAGRGGRRLGRGWEQGCVGKHSEHS